MSSCYLSGHEQYDTVPFPDSAPSLRAPIRDIDGTSDGLHERPLSDTDRIAPSLSPRTSSTFWLGVINKNLVTRAYLYVFTADLAR